MAQKTTLYLDPDDYRRLKLLARRRGRPAAELLREAVAEYARRHAPTAVPRSVGSARTRRGDLGQRAEDLDATVMAVAERLEAEAIATLDLRHFGAVTLATKPRLLPRDEGMG